MRKSILLGTTSLTHYNEFSKMQSERISLGGRGTKVRPDLSTFEIEMGPQQRGIIISNPMKINGNSVFVENSEIDPSELRRALLFWDKLVWPSTNGLYIGGGADVEFLEAEGKVIRPHFFVNGDVATALSMSFVDSYQILEEKHPGKWAVSRGEKSLRIHGKDILDGRGMITHIFNAIPVPNRVMPLQDLISFKEKRFSEVVALRIVVDEFYQSWVSSEDQQHQLQLALAKIDAACADMIKVAKESRLPFSMSSWKINFNITSLDILKSAAVFGGAASFELGTANALLAGGLSAVSFGSDIGLRHAKNDSPFNYVASLERDLF